MTGPSRVSVIIPSWNRADLLRAILKNLREQSRPPEQIIVVDNGSTDDSCAAARELGAEVIHFSENRGFAVAVNAGISKATGEWMLILNNDVVLETNWLETLLESARQDDVSFVAGKLLDHSDSKIIDGSWDLVSRAAYAWRCGYGRPDSTLWSTRRRISFAPMTAAMFHRRVFEKIGTVETRFESYYEDVDFGVRCALAGLEGIYEPKAVARHMGKATLGKASYRVMYLTARNQVLLLAKHYPMRTILRFAWPILVGQTLAVIAAAKHGHLWAAVRGKWDGLRLWSTFRQSLSQDRGAVESTFYASEQTIRNLQREIGFDPYWRLYFSLIGAL